MSKVFKLFCLLITSCALVLGGGGDADAKKKKKETKL